MHWVGGAVLDLRAGRLPLRLFGSDRNDDSHFSSRLALRRTSGVRPSQFCACMHVHTFRNGICDNRNFG